MARMNTKMTPRRQFLVGSLVAVGASKAARAANPKKKGAAAPEWYELRAIQVKYGRPREIVDEYLREALVPALRRFGVGPVGVFETMLGPGVPTFHLLVPYGSPAAMTAVHARLATDPVHQKTVAGLAYQGATAAQPAYVRMESSLLLALEHMPKIVAPEPKGRIFELRTYESPTEATSAKKADMFIRMGETEIFRRSGLTPVFFGRTVIGPRLPNFVYMLTYPDLAGRDKAWNTFRDDPGWLKLKETPGYSDGEILSNVTSILLRPTAYSQI
jgi:hypothetical protein